LTAGVETGYYCASEAVCWFSQK